MPSPRAWIAIAGAGDAAPWELAAAEQAGAAVAEAGCGLVCGGLGGVMEAACRGARSEGGTTVGLLPGTDSLDSMIAATDDGILMDTNRSWSIDDKRLNFQFGCEIGWEIKGGKKTRLLKNPTYTAISPRFWGSLDMLGNRDEWTFWGTPNCGKGQPGQVGHTGHPAAPARFRNVRVGVRA